MKFITEYVDYDNIKYIPEEEEIDGKMQKNYRLNGLMMEAEAKNRNKRWYPKPILEREVIKFNERIKRGNAVGTCDHDSTPNISLDRISHKIESLVMEGNEVKGSLRLLLKTEMGRKVKNLIDESIPLGISSRGVGTLTLLNKNGQVIKPNEKGKINEVPDTIKVNEDFLLLSLDIVLNPSVNRANLQTVTESTDWFLTESGLYVEVANNKFQPVDKNWQSKQILHELNNFLDNIRGKRN
jgi:hypothetical protein